MSVSAADSPLLHSVRQYLEQRGMEIVPASAPFAFLGRYPNNPAVTQGAFLVESIDSVSPEQMEAIAAAASASGIDRILLFADGMFPPEISQKAFHLCISLIDRSELQNLPAKTPKRTPPPLPVGHHTPAAAATPVVTMPPPVHGPVLTTAFPQQAKPKRSFLGQAAILIAALWIGSAGISVMKRHAAELRAKNPAAPDPQETTPRPHTASMGPSSVAKSPSALDFQKRYRLDEVRQLELRRLADDFVRKHEGKIPKVYLDNHRYAISQYFRELDQHPGLALLIIAELPDPSERQSLYDWILPYLVALGDPVLIFRAKTAKATLTRSLKDNTAASESFAQMMQSLDSGESFEFLVDDFVGERGRYIFRNDSESAIAAAEAGRHIPDWLKNLCRGEYHYHVAWGKRGAGTEDSISASKREAYLAELALAEAAFLESWKLNPHHPYAATRMINLSDQIRRNPDDPLHWFEKALSAKIDHAPAYEAYLNSLLASSADPLTAVRQLEKICLHPHVAQTEVPFYLIDMHANAGIREMKSASYWKGLTEEDRRKILSLLEKKLASSEHPAHQRYYLSLKTALLFLFGDHVGSSKLYVKLGDDLDRGAYGKLPISERDLKLNGSIIKRPGSSTKAKPKA